MRKKTEKLNNIKYTSFEDNKKVETIFLKLADLIKLDVLLEEKLISKIEYDKIKTKLGIIADF